MFYAKAMYQGSELPVYVFTDTEKVAIFQG